MARSIEEIRDQIISFKEAQPELSGLSSTSRTAIWRLIAYVIASAIHFHERIYDTFRAELNEQVVRSPAGTPGWYLVQALNFQLGDQVELINDVLAYPVPDDSKKIIKRAAYEDNNDILIIKVARLSSQGIPEALSNPQVTQVIGYFNKIKFAGTKIEVRSVAPDRLRIQGEIYIDPEAPSANYYALMKEAIEGYLSSIGFGGIFYVSKLFDALQTVPGAVDVELDDVKIVNESGSVTTVERFHQLYSGYAILEDSSSYKLESNFTILYEYV